LDFTKNRISSLKLIAEAEFAIGKIICLDWPNRWKSAWLEIVVWRTWMVEMG
jgi:hypothetical protein